MSVPVRRYLGALLALPHRQPTMPRRRTLPVMKEPCILDGYRLSGQSWTYYIISALQIHNDTANIWTHGLAVPVYVFYLAGLMGKLDLSEHGCIGLFCLCFGLVANAMCSSIAHLLHSKSAFLHLSFFMLDYLGVSIYGLCMGILLFYCSGTPAFYHTWGQVFLPLNMVSSVILCASLCATKAFFRGWKSKLLKVSPCLSHCLYIAIPLYYRVWDWLVTRKTQGENLDLHMICSASSALSAFFFASHIPERFWPGKFDLIGHSHMLFHMVVIHSGIRQLTAGARDLQWQDQESKAYVQQTSLSTLLTITAVGLACMITCIYFFLKMAKNDIKKLHTCNGNKTK